MAEELYGKAQMSANIQSTNLRNYSPLRQSAEPSWFENRNDVPIAEDERYSRLFIVHVRVEGGVSQVRSLGFQVVIVVRIRLSKFAA